MFVVLYRWRLKKGREQEFRGAWARATKAIAAAHGAHGSRLHQVDDGSWLAYAQWPDRKAWEQMRASAPVAPEDFQVMADAQVDGAYPVPFLTMTVTDDELRS